MSPANQQNKRRQPTDRLLSFNEYKHDEMMMGLIKEALINHKYFCVAPYADPQGALCR